MNFDNIYLIGSSHVASQSVLEVNNLFNQLNPDIIAVELDENRAYSLKHKVKRKTGIFLIKDIGFFGYLFYLLGQYIQNKYGKLMNIEPGSEMLEAMKLAETNNKQIYFIDRDIRITLMRFSKNIKKREILKMIFDLLFLKKEYKKYKKIDLSKLPEQELIDFVLKETKKNYPSLYKILIDERDKIMAKNLFKLSRQFPDKKILAVCGAGHLKGILSYLEKLSKSHADITY